MEVLSNGSRGSRNGKSPSVEVIEQPKRRRFSIQEKARIVREADACAVGMVGAYLRRERIYSSQLYAWRRERDRGDLDSQTVRNRTKKREAERALEPVARLMSADRPFCVIAKPPLFRRLRRRATNTKRRTH